METEYIRGISFVDILAELDIPTIPQTRFYAAQILLMIHYLHNHYIIYRDLKPENLICDHNGYLKLIDMGSAKILNSNSESSNDERDKNPERTFTLIGTPHYVAPEVVRQTGYSYSADYWSFGVVLFEILCGYLPFAADEEEPYKIYQIIQSAPLEFPEDVEDESYISIVTQLLNKSAEARLTLTSTGLMADDFFASVDWGRLVQLKEDAPFIPKFTSETKSHYQTLKEGIRVSSIDRRLNLPIWCQVLS